MLYTDFNLKTHGFAGHMAEPDSGRTDKSVIVIMGGEKSLNGMSMGTIFAALAVNYIGGIDNIILCSPAHVPLIGLMYRSFHEHKKECLTTLKQSEKEVIDWILQE